MKNLVGVCGLLPKTLNLFKNKLYDFQYPIYDLTLKSIPCFRAASYLVSRISIFKLGSCI